MNQAWHQCFGDRSWAFLCPNGTIFNQVHSYEDDYDVDDDVDVDVDVEGDDESEKKRTQNQIMQCY